MNISKVLGKTGLAAIIIGIMVVGITSCNKQFDQPASNTVLGVAANSTIKQLKAIAGPSGSFVPINGDIIIVGVVSANDKSGNLYKELYLQDASGAIAVQLDATGLYTNFPVGREMAVLCKGLWLANVNGMLKLCVRTVANNVPSVNGIPSALINTYTRRGALNLPVVPKVINNLSELNVDLQGVLIELNNYEVQDQQLDFLYADTSANKSSLNITVKNCTGENIIIRNSAYSDFAGLRVPQGKGSLSAIYTVFNTTKQLLIRDTSDLRLWGIRCDGTNPNTPVVVKTIQSIRALGAGTTVPAYTAIEGVIVSNTANEAAGNYRIQDAGGYGIQLRFLTASNGNFSLGDKLKVNISGLLVEYFNGDLQINNVGRATVVGTGTVTPRVTTVTNINTNINDWSSTVVTLNNVTITQGSSSTSGINYNVVDASGSIVSFVRTTLGYSMPISATSITGYVSLFNTTPQLTIRTAADIVGGVFPNTLLDQNFEGTTTNADIAIADWQNLPEVGTLKFQGKLFGGTKYAQASAFNTGQASVKTWLVTPTFNLNNYTTETLTFKTKDGFNNGATLKVKISTNYNSATNTPWTATWTDLPATIASGTTTGFAANWTNAIVDLSAFSGTSVFIAFVYEGGDPAQTSTYQIDDVRITAN